MKSVSRSLACFLVFAAALVAQNSSKAPSPQAVPSLEAELKQHPDRAKVLVPRIEKLILAQIRAKGPGDRFVLAFVRADAGSPLPTAATFEIAPDTSLRATPEFTGDSVGVESLGGRQTGRFFANNSIHRFKGRVDRVASNTLNAIGSQAEEIVSLRSDDVPSNRLTFAVMNGIGYVYIRGRGTVIVRNGWTPAGQPNLSEIRLGEPK